MSCVVDHTCHPKICFFVAFEKNYLNTKIFQIQSQVKIFTFQKHFTLISKTLCAPQMVYKWKKFSIRKQFCFRFKNTFAG